MKTLFQIGTNSGSGSTDGEVADAIAATFMAHGGRVWIAAAVGRSSVDGVKMVDMDYRWERQAHGLLSRLNDSQGMHSLRATSALIEEMVIAKPDVVQLHCLHGSYIHVPLLMDFLWRSGVPVIATLHDWWLLTGHCLHPTEAGCELFLEGKCSHCQLKKEYPRAWIGAARRNVKMKMRMLKDFDNLHFVVTSSGDAELLHRSWANGHPIYMIAENKEINANFAVTLASRYMEIYDNVM